MAPATVGASGSTPVTQLGNNGSRSAKSSDLVPPTQSKTSGGSKKGARPTVGPADRTGDPTGRVPRHRVAGDDAGAPTASTSSQGGVTQARPTAGSSSATVAKETKAETKHPTTKETVKKAVTSTTSRITKDTASVASTTEKKPARRGAKAAPAGPYAEDEKFLAEQRQLLDSERQVYLAQASDLKAEADSLAQEREPGDVQFDEESGEGGTVTVDRERDLALSAQALAAVEEIDAALAKIADGSYGACERCGQPIPKPRLKALPYARLCVACKSGGLSRR
ncbi:MAG: TraR/DksA C4-type zinc finger protein [Actinomycetota bacterium]|nr:TraR/DksA C4-type zinc finger protein [Actinomycetota bacterium]